MDAYHHVLRRTATLEGERPVFVRLRPDDEWQPAAPDRYRVVACPIPLAGHFCFVSIDGARMCTVGVEHEHRPDVQGGKGWTPAEIGP